MIVLNELEYAEKHIRDGDAGDNPYLTLSILAKYYYHHAGYRRKKVVVSLNNFLFDSCPRYRKNKEYWSDIIDKLASNARKYKLYEIEGVWITKSEFQTIKELHNKVLEKIVFTMLCLAKLTMAKNENSNGWVNYDTKEIFNLARVYCSAPDRYAKLNELYMHGLIDLPKRNDLLRYRIKFIDNTSKGELFVHDFRELGYEYLKYKGENIIQCAECGILTRGNKRGTKKYCANCAGYDSKVTKVIACMDCGKKIEISSKNTKTVRCRECQELKDRERKRIWKANFVDNFT